MADAAQQILSRMHSEASPLFDEYLDLCHNSGWEDHAGLLQSGEVSIGEGDCLIVVDMQNDFVPQDDVTNPRGGAFGVPEGADIAPLIVKLMKHFAVSGAMVIATRDYHPCGHCSFQPSGPFPSHCIQGSVGSQFYGPVGECLHELRGLGRRAEVVFKGFHEDTDSFGSFRYSDTDDTWSRLAHKDQSTKLHGCSLSAWTGCVTLKCSNLDEDVNAPPDVCAVLERESLADRLKREGIKRVFACGLALDFCVLDTVLNGRKAASKAGFQQVSMILDAARAAHIADVGQYGSGFLSDPKQVGAKLAAAMATVVPAQALLPKFAAARPLRYVKAFGQQFPKSLSSFGHVTVADAVIKVDRAAGTYFASKPEAEIKSLQSRGLEPRARMTEPVPIQMSSQMRRALGIPDVATQFSWAFPMESEGKLDETWLGYFAIKTPSAAFFVFGGFVYLDAHGSVACIKACSKGKDVSFSAPQPWKGPAYSAALGARRWHKVTLPYLKQKGAKLFTWINPGEVITPAVGEPWTVSQHGSFAYLFHEDVDQEDSRDVCFSLDFEDAGKTLLTKSKPKIQEAGGDRGEDEQANKQAPQCCVCQ